MNKKKITKSTFKSFIRKNDGKLFIQCVSSFDGMTDCVEYAPKSARVFKVLERKAPSVWDYRHGEEKGIAREEIERRIINSENTLGYQGIWLVGSSRDHFSPYEDENFTGFEVYNCCGSFVVAVKKEAA